MTEDEKVKQMSLIRGTRNYADLAAPTW